MALLIIMMVSVVTGKVGSPLVNETSEEEKIIVATSATLSVVTVGHNIDIAFADRPGKPDDHRSNGDDLPVRPPR